MGIKFELHRFPEEGDSDFCRRMVRRFLKERPPVNPCDHVESLRRIEGPRQRTTGSWIYQYQDEAWIHDELKKQWSGAARLSIPLTLRHLEPVNPELSLPRKKFLLDAVGVTLRQVFCAIAHHLEPIKPLEDEFQLLDLLKQQFGPGLIPISEVLATIAPYIPVKRVDSQGRLLLSELRYQGKAELRRLDWVEGRRYATIDGCEYTHLELLSPTFTKRLSKRMARKMFDKSGDRILKCN